MVGSNAGGKNHTPGLLSNGGSTSGKNFKASATNDKVGGKNSSLAAATCSSSDLKKLMENAPSSFTTQMRMSLIKAALHVSLNGHASGQTWRGCNGESYIRLDIEMIASPELLLLTFLLSWISLLLYSFIFIKLNLRTHSKN